MMSDPAVWEVGLVENAKGIRRSTPEQMLDAMRPDLSEVDRQAFAGGMIDFYLAHIIEGIKPGIEGWRDDFLAGSKPWGFDFASIRVPLQIWHGRQDTVVPISQGERLCAALPSAEAHLVSDEGHASIFEHGVPSVHEWFASRF
jgi:pimeloyl-ACP methyl ester carboxylesterase